MNALRIVLAGACLSLVSLSAQLSQADRYQESQSVQVYRSDTNHAHRDHKLTQSFRRVYQVNMRDRYYRGMNQRIAIKQELKRAYPRLNLRNANLQSVRLMAKSAHGRADAELHIDHWVQDRRNIPGNRRDFNNPSGYTFYPVDLYSFGRESQGPWQVRMDGEIIVRSMIVEISGSTLPDEPGRISYVNIGEERAEKVVAIVKQFPGRNMQSERVRIESREGVVDILEVIIEFSNGQRYSLPQLQGRLLPGQRREMLLRSEWVRNVFVRAVSPDLTGPRGYYSVHLGVLR